MAAPLENAKPDTRQKVEKARMLVSMLGADFARSSVHPFFRDLAKTAIQPVSDDKLSKPEMSRALERLVKHLAEPRRATKPVKAAPPKVESADATPLKQEPDPVADVLKQHPVLIAKHLQTLSAQERVLVLRSLPGRTARMVAAYSAELKKEA